ncbi:hypothetical protein GUJ93_ZPchr0014g47414 [Zizania palustris]|uniref:Uncharacterized protein n=1 Tax=Zizania palustris TaxID=103762 RepID=A0A8J5SXJ2_ZIZPA|nr:hypothetical protein GUJ93_ZPchr0014g47414 [Zizania palustris]
MRGDRRQQRTCEAHGADGESSVGGSHTGRPSTRGHQWRLQLGRHGEWDRRRRRMGSGTMPAKRGDRAAAPEHLVAHGEPHQVGCARRTVQQGAGLAVSAPSSLAHEADREQSMRGCHHGCRCMAVAWGKQQDRDPAPREAGGGARGPELEDGAAQWPEGQGTTQREAGGGAQTRARARGQCGATAGGAARGVARASAGRSQSRQHDVSAISEMRETRRRSGADRSHGGGSTHGLTHGGGGSPAARLRGRREARNPSSDTM